MMPTFESESRNDVVHRSAALAFREGEGAPAVSIRLCRRVCRAENNMEYPIKPKIRVSWDRRSDKKSGLDNRAPREGLNKTPHDRAFRAAPNEGSHEGRGSAQHRALLYEGRS